jgi:hypothetical protein
MQSSYFQPLELTSICAAQHLNTTLARMLSKCFEKHSLECLSWLDQLWNVVVLGHWSCQWSLTLCPESVLAVLRLACVILSSNTVIVEVDETPLWHVAAELLTLCTNTGLMEVFSMLLSDLVGQLCKRRATASAQVADLITLTRNLHSLQLEAQVKAVHIVNKW